LFGDVVCRRWLASDEDEMRNPKPGNLVFRSAAVLRQDSAVIRRAMSGPQQIPHRLKPVRNDKEAAFCKLHYDLNSVKVSA
jgi:hypothetical protein